MSAAAAPPELREVQGPLRPRRRPAPLLRPALADVRDRVQAHLLRHRARLPLVAGAAADALRRSCSSSSPRSSGSAATKSTLPGAAAARDRPLLLLPGSDARTRSPRSSPRRAIVRKTQFPRLVIPLATVLTGAFNLGLNLIVVFAFILAWGVDPTWTWLLFPWRCALSRPHGRGQHAALGPLRPLPRRRDHLDRRRPGALLRDADPLPGHAFRSEPTEQLLMINPLAVIFEQVRVWVLHRTGRPDRRRGRGRRRRPAAGGGDLRRRSASSASGSSTARRRGSPRSSSGSPGYTRPAMAVSDNECELLEELAQAARGDPAAARPADRQGRRTRRGARAGSPSSKNGRAAAAPGQRGSPAPRALVLGSLRGRLRGLRSRRS